MCIQRDPTIIFDTDLLRWPSMRYLDWHTAYDLCEVPPEYNLLVDALLYPHAPFGITINSLPLYVNNYVSLI